jgi:hypothetical protein
MGSDFVRIKSDTLKGEAVCMYTSIGVPIRYIVNAYLGGWAPTASLLALAAYYWILVGWARIDGILLTPR